MISRRLRVQVISEYTFDVLKDIYPMAIKLQIIQIIQDYRKLTTVLSTNLYQDMYKKNLFYDVERNLINFEVFPSIISILDMPNKKIEDLSVTLRQSNPNKNILSFNHQWSQNTELMKILQSLAGIYQCLQIRLFLNLLSIPSLDVIELWASLQAGELYWTENVQDVTNQTPETMLEDQISDSFCILKQLNLNVQEIDKDERVAFIVQFSRHCFNILSISLYSCRNFLIQNRKILSSQHIDEVQKYLFRYAFELFPSKKFNSILLNNSTDVNYVIPGVHIYELEWAMLESSASERNRALSIITAIQLKIENLSRNAQHKSPYQEIQSINEYIKPELKLWRLRSNFLKSTNSDYETSMELYKDIIEDPAGKIASNITRQRETVKVNTEIELLKQYFQYLLSEAAVLFLEKEIKVLATSSKENENFGMIKPDSFNSGFEKKTTLLNNFLSVMRNRGTTVAAPGGKALVYTIKDLTTLTKRFADQIQRFKESEHKENFEKIVIDLSRIKEKIIAKEKLLLGYKKNTEELEIEVSNMVNARLTQKGAQIMYELDVSQRQLKEIKENTKELEISVKNKITSEYEEKYKEKIDNLNSIKDHFFNYQAEVSDDFKKCVETSKIEGMQEIKKIINYAEKNEETEVKIKDTKKVGTLVIMQEALRKIREIYQWKRLNEMQNFEKYINELKEQLTSNQYLLEQLSESRSREALLKQELNYTQVALNSTESLISKLQTQIREMQHQQYSLQQFKTVSYNKITKLEKRAKEIKNYEIIDSQKVASKCIKQDKLISSFRYAELAPIDQYKSFHNKYSREIERLKAFIKNERKIVDECIYQIKQAQGESDGMERHDMIEWKKKYYELLNSKKVLPISNSSRIKNYTPEPFSSKSRMQECPNYSTPQKSFVKS